MHRLITLRLEEMDIKLKVADSDLTIDVDRAAFGLVYYNTAQGWLFTEK